MIINKVYPFQTEEERQKIEDLREENARLGAALKLRWEAAGEKFFDKDYLDNTRKNEKAAGEIVEAIEKRYIESFKERPGDILKDVQEIVDAYEKQDYLEYIENWKIVLAPGRLIDLSQAKGFEHYKEENFEDCYNLIFSELRVQLEALAEYYKNPRDHKKVVEQVHAIIRRRVSQWYTEKKATPAYLPMTHGRPTDALAFMRRRNVKEDPISELATLQTRDGVTITYPTAETWGVSADQLFSTLLAIFTEQNDFRHPQNIKREITMPLIDYGLLKGKDVTNPDKKKAKNNMDNIRKRVKKDLETIQKQTITWTESVKGKPKNFVSISLVSSVGIINGQIHIALTPEIAEYFANRNTITMLPTSLLPLDPQRDKNAYQLGRKLAEHYSMDPNVERGTNTIISVQAALAATDLPSFEEVQATDRGHWAERIKEPLEAALDRITGAGQYLKDWKYTHAKGEELTDSEAANISTYQDFEKLYIVFTPQEELDNAARIARNKEKQEKQTNKKSGQK